MLTAPYQIAYLFNLRPDRPADAEVITLVVRLLAITKAAAWSRLCCGDDFA